MDKLDFPGVVFTRTTEVLVVHSQQPLTVLSSAVVGGGMVRVRSSHSPYKKSKS
jgi:hypothetical protein